MHVLLCICSNVRQFKRGNYDTLMCWAKPLISTFWLQYGNTEVFQCYITEQAPKGSHQVKPTLLLLALLGRVSRTRSGLIGEEFKGDWGCRGVSVIGIP